MWCLLFGHKWGGWKYNSYPLGYYNEKIWYERVCERCGKVEIKEQVSWDELFLKKKK